MASTATASLPPSSNQETTSVYPLPSSAYPEPEGAEDDEIAAHVGFDEVERDQSSWAGNLPKAQGLYDPDNEKDVSTSMGRSSRAHVRQNQRRKGGTRRGTLLPVSRRPGFWLIALALISLGRLRLSCPRDDKT
jgi:hypothetical protein